MLASKGKSIVKVQANESINTLDHRTMELVLTLFDGAVITTWIPAVIESGDESFIRSYSERIISPILIGQNPTNQVAIDAILSRILKEDHLSDKMKKLAKNVNWAASAAICKAGAYATDMPCYKYVRKLYITYEPEYKGKSFNTLICVFSITDDTAIRLHLLLVYREEGCSTLEAIEIARNIFDSYFKDKIAEDERYYTPTVQDIKRGLEELTKIINHLGYKRHVSIGLNVGASQFHESNDSYHLRWNKEDNNAQISAEDLNDVYKSLLKQYDLDYIEDAFHHTNWDYFYKLDLAVRPIITVTGEKWKLIDEYKKSRVCNSLLLKVSKAESVSELIKFMTVIEQRLITTVMDTHSCDDSFIADLCVGLMVDYMKIGVSCVTGDCKVCDQLNEIENKGGEVRFCGYIGGRLNVEVDIGDTDDDEWNRRNYIYD